jgi:tellurite resistance protein TerC
MHVGIWGWIAFNAFVLAMLALDLGVFNRKPHAVGFREALGWTIAWVALALTFNLGVYHTHGALIAQEFLAGYLIEKSLSVDNIFVFYLIFSYFGVENRYQHRVLFWGILGALVLRGVMIAAGVILIAKFHWIIYVFGAFLVLTGIRMATHDAETLDPGNTWVMRFARRFLPVTNAMRGKNFVVRENDKWYVTPLFLVLLVVETTDVVFAVDSIPAIFAVTRDPFVVYTSNVFAILGLRALYFLLASVIGMFRYLKFGLSFILVFVGIKMLLSDSPWKIPTLTALLVIAAALVISVLASILAAKHESRKSGNPDSQEP